MIALLEPVAVLGQLEAEDRDFLWCYRAPPQCPAILHQRRQNALATEDAKLPALYPAHQPPLERKTKPTRPRAIALDTGVQTPLAGNPKPAALTLQSNPSGSITQQAFADRARAP